MKLPEHERQRIAFGDELRTIRKSKKATGVEVAKLTGISQSKLSKIETGALIPSTQDLLQILNVLSVSDTEAQRIIENAQALRTEYVSWRFEHRQGLGLKQARIAELERETKIIREFRIEAVPGLLQTYEYARCVLDLANLTHQPDLSLAVNLRMQRQHVLYDPNRQFHFLIAEMGLLSRFCAPEIAIRQLDRLRVLSELPNVTIGLIPNRVHLPRGPINSFVLFDSSAAFFESITGEISSFDERSIEAFQKAFDDFAAAAVYGDAAGRFLDECAHHLLEIASLNALNNQEHAENESSSLSYQMR